MNMDDMGEGEYKSFDEELNSDSKKIQEEMGITKENISYSEKFKDPVLLAALLTRTLEEKKRTNELLSELVRKLDKLDELEIELGRLREFLGAGLKKEEQPMLGDVDERIVEFMKKVGQATSVEVQKALKYRGRNGASARLHKLYLQGFLEKKQAGRKVYYLYKQKEGWQGDR